MASTWTWDMQLTIECKGRWLHFFGHKELPTLPDPGHTYQAARLEGVPLLMHLSQQLVIPAEARTQATFYLAERSSETFLSWPAERVINTLERLGWTHAT